MPTKQYDSLPKPTLTYAGVIKSMLPIHKRSQNKSNLPDLEYKVKGLRIDIEHLERYREVCGFTNDGKLPAPYLTVLSQSLQMNMMTNPKFPFAMLGLVHIENGIKQHRPIAQYEVIDLAVTFGALQPHDKGQQFDFIITAFIDGETVWEGTSTYLVRDKTTSSKTKGGSDKKSKPTPSVDDIHAIWSVPADIGRRYALVSGDFNLIHIHPVTAKVLGFKAAIAHGLWSLARSTAELGDLPHAFDYQASFKLPIFLPAQVELIASQDDQGNIDYTLYDAKSDKPHVVASITAL